MNSKKKLINQDLTSTDNHQQDLEANEVNLKISPQKSRLQHSSSQGQFTERQQLRESKKILIGLSKYDCSISDFTLNENSNLQQSLSYLDKKTIEQYHLDNKQIQKMMSQVLDMSHTTSQQIENLRLGINDAMRKVHRILCDHNPNQMTEVSSAQKFIQKIRILEDEHYYYKINIQEEIRPCSITLKLDEGQCNIYVSFRNEQPSKLIHDFYLKKQTNIIFPSSYKGKHMFICIQGIFDSNGVLVIKFLENEKKRFENLHNSIQEMIEDKKTYNEFQKIVEVIQERRKKQRRQGRTVSHDEYLVKYQTYKKFEQEQEKQRREMAIVRKEQNEELQYQRKIMDINRKETRILQKLEQQRIERKVQREKLKVVEWIRWYHLNQILQRYSKSYLYKRDINFKRIRRIIMCNRIKRNIKCHLKRFGEDLTERLQFKSQRILRFLSQVTLETQNQRASQLICELLKDTAQIYQLKQNMILHNKRVVYIQQFWRRNVKTKIVQRMVQLDQYWQRIVTELNNISSEITKFIKFESKMPPEQKKKVLFEAVVQSFHKFRKHYVEWEKDLATKPSNVQFASRILERFTSFVWNESYTKQRITLELKNYVEKHGTGKNKKTQLQRYNTLINMNETSSSYEVNKANETMTSLKKIQKRNSEFDREKQQMIENFIKEQQKKAQPAPKQELIIPVQEFIAQIKQVHEELFGRTLSNMSKKQ
ncbi:UNKNOWN [Stylonychia lemnae]|uniref:Uncharacterized protein n=1 Tax=Stylonychia lemnae TaxID=5949 RepID=A0A078AG10_STYLE|nr:UNKNOWN [Stylonychia lemnae]|eukprot:CDW81245.1 UNKNOWN [Stylonychia lemnae]